LRRTKLEPQDAAFGIIREGDDAATVRSAIMALGYTKGPNVYPVLLSQLDNPNPSIQHAAVISLGRFGKAEAIKELVKPKIFRSSTSNIRWAAVAAVGKLGDCRVIDHLLKAVEDPEWIVRTQAVTEVKGKVQDIIERKDARLARVLAHMLSLDNEEIVDMAVNGFKELGAETVPLLHEALTNSSATIRTNAARALGKLHSHQSVPFLLELLQDSQWKVRASASEALGLIGDKRAIEALLQALQDNVSHVQDAAVVAIVRFGKRAVMPLLNAISREKNKYVLKALIICLGQTGDPKVVPALTDHLRSSYFVIRQAAVSSLIHFGPLGTALLIPTLSFNRSDIESLEKDACGRERPELQVRAIKALGGLEDHRAVPVLKELAEVGLPDIREAATQALCQIGCAAWGRACALRVLADVGDASLVPLITASFKDDSDNVRLEAVRALGMLGGPIAVKHLIQTARIDRSPSARTEAVQALRTHGTGHPGVPETALHCLKDKSRDVRSQAARLLGIIQDKKAIIPLLKAMADSHWIVRESAEYALLNYGKDAVESLIEALEDKVLTTRFRSARLLGEIGDPRAVSPLRNVIGRRRERRGVREIAERSLRKIEAKIPS